MGGPPVEEVARLVSSVRDDELAESFLEDPFANRNTDFQVCVGLIPCVGLLGVGLEGASISGESWPPLANGDDEGISE